MLCGSADGVGVRGIDVSPDGGLAATATAQGRVVLWDVATCAVARAMPPVRGRVNAVDFSPRGDLVAAACGDGVVRVYTVADAEEVYSFAAHAGPVFAVAFSPDGQRIATAGAEATQAGAGAEQGARQGQAVRNRLVLGCVPSAAFQPLLDWSSVL